MAILPLQMAIGALLGRWTGRLEQRLETERDRIGLWLPVAIGAGITAWFILPHPLAWGGMLALCLAAALTGRSFGGGARWSMLVSRGALAAAAGLALVWGHSWWASGPVVARPVSTSFSGIIRAIEPMPARAATRLIIEPIGRSDLPPRVRLSLSDRDLPQSSLIVGSGIGLRARLMPPPGPTLPGGYDFAQRAWFDNIGAVGSVIGRPVLAKSNDIGREGLRTRLSRHIQSQLPASAGGIASALATGDRGAISDADSDAMQKSGLAHLLSISGLHVTAVVGGAIFLLMRLLALNRTLALRNSVPLLAAAGGALAGVGYTLLTGAEVPTVRSCVAALLVLAALAMGREAVTLRLVAAGALLVMLLWPEAVAGPSFQLSFTAVTVIVALHEHPRTQALLERRGEGVFRAFVRTILGLIITGFAIEAALTPIALFHFHQAGLYGAFANVVAIPLTTFVIMPAEALALALDSVGAGAPAWWIVGEALNLLLAIAHGVAAAPGAVYTLPRPSAWGFGLAVSGMLWLLLWHSNWRWWGGVPILAGCAMMAVAPVPDLLVTSDGRHIAVQLENGDFATLRARAGDYVRDQLGEASGSDAAMLALADAPGSECNADMCRWTMHDGDRPWQILATRSNYRVEGTEMMAACAAADIVIADRWLPPDCKPRWVVIDRDDFDRHGGVAVYLDRARIVTAIDPSDAHPWRKPPQVSGNDEADPPISPAP